MDEFCCPLPGIFGTDCSKIGPKSSRLGTKTGADVEAVFRRLRSEAERQGEDAFHELHARHQQRLKREQEKGTLRFPGSA